MKKLFFLLVAGICFTSVFAQPNEYNEVVYDIIKPVAWDYISWDDSFTELISNADFFVFGNGV